MYVASLWDMGCLFSTAKSTLGNRKLPRNIGAVSVFVPGLRIPKPLDFSQYLVNQFPKSLIELLHSRRARVLVMAEKAIPLLSRMVKKCSIGHGSLPLSRLLQALEDYLPVLLGLAREGFQMHDEIPFTWVNQEDGIKESCICNCWYEVLSVLHLMGMILLSQANILLLPNKNCRIEVFEGNRRQAIEVFWKAAGYLDCAVVHVLHQIPVEQREHLPVDLAEGVLSALTLQCLGQCSEIQLGMAIESPRATLAVKRRLACEMVQYWKQARECIANLPLNNGLGQKHRLFIKWKYSEAEAAAYYYHGSVLDESVREKHHHMATAAMRKANGCLQESKETCKAFNMSSPVSTAPHLWGTMKYLYERISRDTNCNGYTSVEEVPILPDFQLALKPDDYQLPPMHPSWNQLHKIT